MLLKNFWRIFIEKRVILDNIIRNSKLRKLIFFDTVKMLAYIMQLGKSNFQCNEKFYKYFVSYEIIIKCSKVSKNYFFETVFETKISGIYSYLNDQTFQLNFYLNSRHGIENKPKSLQKIIFSETVKNLFGIYSCKGEKSLLILHLSVLLNYAQN